MTFPEDCLQSLIQPSEWWVKQTDNELQRGSLIFAFSPHIDQIPYTFKPIGRTVATEHGEAKVRVEPLKVDAPLQQTDLPVAAMTLNQNEVFAAYRAKKRPCLVLSAKSIEVKKELIRGKPKHSTTPTFLAAPFYGVVNNNRAGYSKEFIERVRHCEYPQFHWDFLPFPGGEESILRLDQLQPFGTHYNSYKKTGYMLSKDAIDLIDDMFRWVIWGGVKKDSIILDYRNLVESTFS